MASEEVEVGMARVLDDEGERYCVVVVGGPDQEGEIALLAGAWTYLPRQTALALAAEIVRRIGASR